MTKIKVLQTVAKMYLAAQYIEGQFQLIKGFVKQDYKLAANRAHKNTTLFCEKIERNHTEKSLENAENDTELFSSIIDAFIQAEEKEVTFGFKNDFKCLCDEYGINIEI